jgi:glycosyltransferase involved in cell wall biosynthesis
MRLFFYFALSFLFLAFEVNSNERKTVCLNMIVKNESEVITRCLASVKPMIDYWVIVDTGSTDGTQEIIRDFMKDVKGDLYERPWINFGHNRNEALELAKDKADYILVIDADETLEFSRAFQMPELKKDFYYITTEFGGTKYGRVQLIKSDLDWKWKGVLHEALYSSDAKSSDTLDGVINFVRTDGARSKNPNKFLDDAQLLEKALVDEPNNTRYVFYLAQSYRDAQEYESALKYYQKRVSMGGWDQEIYWSLLQTGLLQEQLKMPPETIIKSYITAYLYRPTRIEALYRLARYQRILGNHEAAYNTAQLGLALEKSKDALFVEHWIYDYGLLLEFSIAAYWKEKYFDALLVSNALLANPDLPPNFKECVEGNLVWINNKIKDSKSGLKDELVKELGRLNAQPMLNTQLAF